MIWLAAIQDFFNTLERRTFYLYSAISVAALTLIILLTFWYYISAKNAINDEIDTLNSQRETIQDILTRGQVVQEQRQRVNQVLAKEEDFKILDYFSQLINQLGITEKNTATNISNSTREDKYKEDILQAQFIDMNMQELTELLQEIEKKENIYTKDLEINKSRKKPKTVEVNITIGTLLPEFGT